MPLNKLQLPLGTCTLTLSALLYSFHERISILSERQPCFTLANLEIKARDPGFTRIEVPKDYRKSPGCRGWSCGAVLLSPKCWQRQQLPYLNTVSSFYGEADCPSWRKSPFPAQQAAADRRVCRSYLKTVCRIRTLEGRVGQCPEDDRWTLEIFCFWESRTMWLRLALNSSSSWLSFMISRIPGVCHPIQQLQLLLAWGHVHVHACTYMHICSFYYSPWHFLNYFSSNKFRMRSVLFSTSPSY